MRVSNDNTTQEGAAAVLFAKGVNFIKNFTFKGSGTTSVALGYFINHDPSNAEDYPNAMHFQEKLVASGGGSFYNIEACEYFNIIAPMSIPGAKLSIDTYFGNPPNVDNPFADSLSNLDALTQASLIKENDNSSSLVYNIVYTNLYNKPANIYAFIDVNKDNKFSSAEAVTRIAPANTTNGVMTITWPNFNHTAGEYVIRFRITTETLVDNSSTTDIDERSTGLATNGEVTDRIVKVLTTEEYNTALPTTIVSFTGKQQNGRAYLNWKTNHEEDIVSYVVEKSLDGKNWMEIGEVSAENDIINEYSFEDIDFGQTSLYRLRIVERYLDKVVYSSIISIFGQEQKLSIYPNPTDGLIHLIGVAISTPINIYDMSGKIVMSTSYNGSNIDITSLRAGNYIIDINRKHQFIVSRK